MERLTLRCASITVQISREKTTSVVILYLSTIMFWFTIFILEDSRFLFNFICSHDKVNLGRLKVSILMIGKRKREIEGRLEVHLTFKTIKSSIVKTVTVEPSIITVLCYCHRSTLLKLDFKSLFEVLDQNWQR